MPTPSRPASPSYDAAVYDLQRIFTKLTRIHITWAGTWNDEQYPRWIAEREKFNRLEPTFEKSTGKLLDYINKDFLTLFNTIEENLKARWLGFLSGTADYAELRPRIQAIIRDLQSLMIDAAKTVNSNSANVETVIAAGVKELQDKIAQQEITIKELAAQLSTMTEQADDYKAKAASATSQIDNVVSAKNARIAMLEGSLQKADQRIVRFDAQIAVRDIVISGFDDQRTELGVEVWDQLMKRDVDIKALEIELSEVRSEAAVDQARVDALNEELKKQVKDRNGQIGNLQKQLATAQADLETARNEVARLQRAAIPDNLEVLNERMIGLSLKW